MSDRLWFIAEEGEIVAVYDSREIAKEELFYRKEDAPTNHFRVYSLSATEIENYPDEHEMASSEGLI